MTVTTHSQLGSVSEPTLYVAFELGQRSWTVAMTAGLNVVPWVRTLVPGDWAKLTGILARARERFGLPATARVVSCYEAGRDGFWIHRWLVQAGIANRVVDSASIEVNRRARRMKTDRLDARKLVLLLVRVCLGDHTAWREVRVPSEADEAARHVSREREDVVAEHTAVINQMRGWLTTWGAMLPSRRPAGWWAAVLDAWGRPLAAPIQARLARATERLHLLEAHLQTLAAEQRAAVRAAPAASAAGRLRTLTALGVKSISTFLDEGLIWRQFQNRRQVGGMLGFAPTHFQSGTIQHDRGISRAGNRRLQAMSIQVAWMWVRYQPDSPVTQWFLSRFGVGKRRRRIGIVAVARRLLIALWRYATTGLVPAGARLKTV